MTFLLGEMRGPTGLMKVQATGEKALFLNPQCKNSLLEMN